MAFAAGGAVDGDALVVTYAIYEIVGLILAIPLSYGLARLVRFWSGRSWLDEVDEVFQRNWNGRPEDELYAWMKTRNDFQSRPGRRTRQKKYIEEEISRINRRKLYSEFLVSEEGVVEKEGQTPGS